MFREDKATAMAAHLLGLAPDHTLEDLSLMKLMVIAERRCMAQTTSLIAGAQFVSMQNGPVLSEVLDVMRGKAESDLWSQTISFVPHAGPGTPSNCCVLTGNLDPADYLSEFELGLLTSVWAEHGQKHKWQLVQLTHAFPEWDRTCAKTKSSKPISLESIFRLGFDEPDASAQQRAQAIEYFERVAG